MWRVLGRWCALWGCIVLGMVGSLAYARRDDPPDWIVFTVARKYGLGYDYYAVLSDGTHTRFLASSNDQYSLRELPDNPGWLEFMDTSSRGDGYQLIHLTGTRRLVIRQPTNWPQLYFSDQMTNIVYLLDNYDTSNVISAVNLITGASTRYELPINLTNLRRRVDKRVYIFWSDHASKGDFYEVKFDTPPKIRQLTTRGDVLSDYAAVIHKDWLYYRVDDGNPDPYQPLYRIRPDGTHEELVTEGLLNISNAMIFYQSDGDWIYYWGGAVDHPHLIQARPDGSDPIDLPVSVLYGWVRAWSADHQWVYYTEISPDYMVPASEGGNLRRVNLQTGENPFVWEMSNVQGVAWSADQQWLLLVTTEQNGYMALHRVRPDGTDDTLLNDELRGYLNPLPDPSLVAFDTWGEVGKEIHLFDLKTLEIRPLHDDAPLNRMRQFVTALPMPNTDAPLDWLIGIGAMAFGVGLLGMFWRRA